jgi:predicted acylesterase/phospholipase RssA
MAETSEGHVSSTSDSGETPREVPVRVGAGGVRVPSPAPAASAPPQLGRPPIEQLQARQHELEEARRGLEEECAQLEREIMQRRAEGERARARACDVHWRIVEDDDGLLQFARASQNIAAPAALLRRLPEPATAEERKT